MASRSMPPSPTGMGHSRTIAVAITNYRRDTAPIRTLHVTV